EVVEQIKLEPGIGATQIRQHPRQQEWANSGDRAHSQRAAKRLLRSAGGTRKLLEIHDGLAGTLERGEAKRGQDDVALGAVAQRRLEHVLELLDAGAQGRLGHAAGLGSAAELAMVGERHQVAQMPYGGQMLHAIAPNRGGGSRVAGTPPEFHAAEGEGGHKLSVMAVTKMRFLLIVRNTRGLLRLAHGWQVRHRFLRSVRTELLVGLIRSQAYLWPEAGTSSPETVT